MSGRKSKSAEKEMEVDEVVDGHEEEEEDEEEGEGEYEVEAIIDHKQKKGNQAGKYEYLVSWKGYGPEHNTWEPEEHVAHAGDIVTRYWSGKPKQPIAPTSQSKKRDRPSAGGSSTPVPTSQKKSAARTNGNSRKSVKQQDDEDEEEFPTYEISHVDSTAKYEDVPDWEDTIISVDTIERSSRNELTIYMTMVGGEKVAVPTELAYKRCPQKVLQFYEKHLKWKSS
ncbi:uncharacterized protein I303_106181 [Kwoniella dejecticola CBS 10117]|uniref:Chromo domain-containing protein n=1 Tax=Kwoniella dejecticola CBS 10117 TaxID=1296121 RepID=A0A1A6A1H5_9TREE|nr:uncharacterized protein I303_06199 [Kwoniella dejecticola CBS 10117]OBR83914.1 hypothetical protein I303_06199 [Kwoniella dejecticola CBS 10117]